MKILHVTQHYLPFFGGVEISVHEICKRLAKYGYNVEVLCEQEKNTPEYEFLDGVEIHRVQAYEAIGLRYSMGRISLKMLQHVHSTDADIIHAHAYGFFPTWTTLFSEKPIIITTHSSPMAKIYPLWDMFRAIPIQLCDRVVATTEMEKAHLIKRGVRPERITVIPNGITLPPPIGTDVGIHPMILCLGRIDMDHKGQDVLLIAMKKVQNFVPGVKLVIAGSGKDLLKAKNMAKDLLIDHSTIFTGSLSETNKWNYIQSCDVLCIPSRTEPFSLVCLEGMALGKPIVTTNSGGIMWVAGEAAITVPPNNSSLLANALIRVLTNKDLANELARKGLQRVESFNWNQIVPKYKALYETLAEM
jgi:glycosyltransferase involved in cell wall biosynthesis